jgi:hypothetical protein
MPVLRIVKKYNNKSALNGVIVEDKVTFDSKSDGVAWVIAVLNNKALDFDLVDYAWVVVDLGAHGETFVEFKS